MVTDAPTVADAFAYSVVVNVQNGKETILDDFPALKKWKADFENIEEVKAYLAISCIEWLSDPLCEVDSIRMERCLFKQW